MQKIRSPSSLRKWFTCPRLWGYYYLARWPTPTTEAQATGRAVASAIEYEVKGVGESPGADVRAMVAELRPYLRGRDLAAEVSLQATLGSHNVGGRADLVEGVSTIWDIKTTSNLRYAHTPTSLSCDLQALVYAYALGGEAINLRWLYVEKRSYRTRLVQARVQRSFIVAKMHKLLPVLDAMVAADAHGDPERLLVEYAGCPAFGGCPYLTRCSAPAEQKAIALMTTPSNIPWYEKVTQSTADTGQIPAGPYTDQVNRPAPSPDPVQAAPAPSPDPVQAAPTPSPDPVQAAPAPSPDPVQAAPAPSPDPVQAAPAPSPDPVQAAPAPSPDPVQAAPAPSPEYTLCWNCIPVRVEGLVIQGDELITRAAAVATQWAQTGHWRFARYGQGAGLIQSALRETLKNEIVNLRHNYVVVFDTPDARVCRGVFVEYAKTVIQGL